jgi:hypothetical protein
MSYSIYALTWISWLLSNKSYIEYFHWISDMSYSIYALAWVSWLLSNKSYIEYFHWTNNYSNISVHRVETGFKFRS